MTMDQQTFEELVERALQWSAAQEKLILEHGMPLRENQAADARLVGVRETDRIRILLVDRIEPPDDPELAEAARRNQIITDASRGVTIGHGIVIRADAWGNRELLLHQFVHVAQCEKAGGLEPAVREYLIDRRDCPEFTVGALEEEARRIAHEIVSKRS